MAAHIVQNGPDFQPARLPLSIAVVMGRWQQVGMGPAESEIELLRTRLRGGEATLLDKYSGRLDVVERVRPWLVAGAGIGATLIAASRLVEGTASVIVATVGIVATLIFGILVGLADFRKLEISREAREAMTVADEALARAAIDAAALDDQSRRRALRDERLSAGKIMREIIGVAAAGGYAIGDGLDTMLDAAKLRVVAACGFDAAEYWAITIFTLDPAVQEMMKIAALWNDVTASVRPSRGWGPGEGFTGVAWMGGGPVVVPDMTLPGVADAFQLPPGKRRDHDGLRYRSAAAIPIFVENAVWGIVTATSDRANRFDLATPGGAEAVEAVRDISQHAALLAIMDRLLSEEDADDD